MDTTVAYQIETPGGVVIYRNVPRDLGWILAQSREADMARSAGDVAGAARIAGLVLQHMGDVAVSERPADFWQVATRLQVMVDDADRLTASQQPVTAVLDGQLSLF